MIRAHITKPPPGWSGPERAELAWSQPLQLAPARPGSFSAKSAWSQRFPTGVSCSSWSQRGVRRLGLESAVFVGVSVESAVPGWSQRGVRCFGLESAWSQAFPAGVSVGPARSQLLVARGPWAVGRRGAMGHGRCLLCIIHPRASAATTTTTCCHRTPPNDATSTEQRAAGAWLLASEPPFATIDRRVLLVVQQETATAYYYQQPQPGASVRGEEEERARAGGVVESREKGRAGEERER